MGIKTDHNRRVVLHGVTLSLPATGKLFSNLSIELPNEGIVMVRANPRNRTALVELLAGHLKPQRGSVRIAVDLASSAEARGARRVARSRTALFPALSPRDHLLSAARSHGTDPEDLIRRIGTYELRMGLDSPVSSLGAGVRAELWLLLCTVGEFSIAILEEPFQDLGPNAQSWLQQEIALWRAAQRLVVIVAQALPKGVNPDVVLQL